MNVIDQVDDHDFFDLMEQIDKFCTIDRFTGLCDQPWKDAPLYDKTVKKCLKPSNKSIFLINYN